MKILNEAEVTKVEEDFKEIAGVKSQVKSSATFEFPRIMRGSLDKVKKSLNALPYIRTYMVSYTESENDSFYTIVGTIDL